MASPSPLMEQQQWTESIFTCFSDCFSYWCVLAVPLFGSAWIQARAVEMTRESKCDPCAPWCLHVFCGCFGMALNRTRIRKELDIPGSWCSDYCLYMYCCPFMVCQEWREVHWRLKPDQVGKTIIDDIMDD